ncbi:flagellar hook-basal body complex protein FliE [Parahaliea aestuarii]|uniref:Flagellar hook-basal body complex protein FliE n=1 Tax=Parahaliea aestuarii TaxID=1852021 RepID=A0A5C9A6I6_9GAMM|nr:flagellar hook-basal body complex protein FliE [Parahaliea aestuarii]TXS94791.1 flagellar hook-basal body complex protein FliE [Parahaliea aestuarii]
MSSEAIQSALAQMNSLASQAAGNTVKGSQVNMAVGGGSFGEALYGAARRINELSDNATRKAEAFQRGEPGIELHDVMMDGQKASIAFELGVQVRNRLVSAYKDVMNMQV